MVNRTLRVVTVICLTILSGMSYAISETTSGLFVRSWQCLDNENRRGCFFPKFTDSGEKLLFLVLGIGLLVVAQILNSKGVAWGSFWGNYQKYYREEQPLRFHWLIFTGRAIGILLCLAGVGIVDLHI